MPTDPGTTHGTTPPPPPGSSGPRRLVRHPDHGPLGGVCAGLADYLNVDPTIVRIAAVVLACTGPGLPAYILAWIFVPADDGHVMAPWPHNGGRRGDRTTQIVGIALIAIALSVLWGDWWRPARGWFVPVGLIAVGAWMLLRNHDDDSFPPAPPAPPVPPTPGTPPAWQANPPTTPLSVAPAPAPPAGATEPTATDPSTDPPTEPDAMDSTQLTDAPDATDATDTTSVFEPPPPGDGPPTPGWASPGVPGPAYQPRPRRRRVLGPAVFGALLLWGGIAWLAGVSVEDGLAVGLCLVGAGFVIGAFTGGSKALIMPALLIGAALVVVSTVDIPLGSGIGDRNWTVTSMRDLDRTYKLGIGDATLDLRNLQLPASGTVHVDVKVGLGHITVVVPEDAALQIDTEAGAGSSDVLGHEEGGSSVDTHRTVKGQSGAGKLDLDLKVGLGRIDVREEPADFSLSAA